MKSKTAIKVEILRSKYADGSACKVRISGTVRGIAIAGMSQHFLDSEPVRYPLVRSILDGRVWRAAGGKLPFASETAVYLATLKHLRSNLKPDGRTA